jgi:N-acetylglucosamine-6-phosphate deacetylase
MAVAVFCSFGFAALLRNLPIMPEVYQRYDRSSIFRFECRIYPVMYLLENAVIYTPDSMFPQSNLLIRDGRIAALSESKLPYAAKSVQRFDARGLILAPGFIDLQINGGFGLDFTADPASLWQVAAQLPRYGVTAFLPTLITSPPERIVQALTILSHEAPPDFCGAAPLGWHLEGPFLNPNKKGAHSPNDLCQPSLEAVKSWSLEEGVRLVTLAPELPGALDVACALQERGVVVSAGHSLATFAQAQAGFDIGITCGTHIFNAMTSIHQRDPGLPGALLNDPRVSVSLIADGIHVHPALVQLAWQTKGSQGLILVSDAMAALGMPPGEYRLGEVSVSVDDKSARLADGTLAGSILSLDAALRNLVAITGATLPEALSALTRTPARLLRLADCGRIAPGCIADLVLLTPDLEVVATWVRGELVYQRAEGVYF